MKLFILSAFLLYANATFAVSVTPTATLTLIAGSDETFTSGGSLTFTATAVDYPADTSALAWAVSVPAGWTFASASGDYGIGPSPGTTEELEWAYFNIPADSASFTFTVHYPADITTNSVVSAEVVIRTTSTTGPFVLPVEDLVFTPAPSLDNGIEFQSIAAKRANDNSFTLAATSTSGLPITYTVVSGPALISGNTITLTGATGTVVIRAEQAGDLYYVPADSVTQSFNVLPAGPLIYFGTTSDGTEFAAQIPAGKTTGTLIGEIANTGQYYFLMFQVEPDNTITVLSLQILENPQDAATSLAFKSPHRGLSTRQAINESLAYTFTGTLQNGVISLRIAELGVTLTGNIEPATGPTVAIAGLYESSSLNSASGTTTSIVGTNGKVYVIAITPKIISGGTGTIATNGAFNLTTAKSVTITGNVDAPSTTVSGTIVLPDGEADAFAGLSTNTLRTDRLINLSTRAWVQSAAGSPLITGFVVGGTDPKRVLLRAVGPSLADYGIASPVADPRITLFDADGNILTAVDNWNNDINVAMAATVTGAFPLAADSLDAALVTELAPGRYTLHVNNAGNGGVAIAEIYDASENPNSQYQRLINISSRGMVGSGEDVLVGGFVVTGNSPKRVLIRGVGPGLAAYGVLGTLNDPRLRVFNANRQVVASNNNWQVPAPVFSGQRTATASEIETAESTVGAFALVADSADAALIITLNPGAYTVELASADALGTGSALIEIYEIPE